MHQSIQQKVQLFILYLMKRLKYKVSNKLRWNWKVHKAAFYLVNVKTIRQIAQIFVAFSEKLNFNKAL